MPVAMRTRAFSLVTLATLVGCGADRPMVGPQELGVPEGVLQAVVQQLPGETAGTTEYVVRVVGRVPELAAYQGTVTFDPAELEVMSVRTPTGGDGEMHVVNSESATDGAVKFAVFAPEKLATDEAFTMVVRSRRSGGSSRVDAAPAMAVALEVAGTRGGTEVEKSRLRSSDGVRDRSGRLIK